MPWTITKPGPGESALILNGSLVVGSVVRINPADPTKPHTFRVEVLWSGPAGDICFETPYFDKAEAFARGVEATMDAVLGPAFSRYLDWLALAKEPRH